MNWTELNFGKHKGKTLPQVVFDDPDWFFWAYEKGVFKDRRQLREEAEELYKKSTSIKIPKNENNTLQVAYIIDGLTKKFCDIHLISSSEPEHRGTSIIIRDDFIDLSTIRQIKKYDKKGGNVLVSSLKVYLFGDRNYRLTKERCEAFFNDDSNFSIKQ